MMHAVETDEILSIPGQPSLSNDPKEGTALLPELFPNNFRKAIREAFDLTVVNENSATTATESNNARDIFGLLAEIETGDTNKDSTVFPGEKAVLTTLAEKINEAISTDNGPYQSAFKTLKSSINKHINSIPKKNEQIKLYHSQFDPAAELESKELKALCCIFPYLATATVCMPAQVLCCIPYAQSQGDNTPTTADVKTMLCIDYNTEKDKKDEMEKSIPDDYCCFFPSNSHEIADSKAIKHNSSLTTITSCLAPMTSVRNLCLFMDAASDEALSKRAARREFTFEP